MTAKTPTTRRKAAKPAKVGKVVARGASGKTYTDRDVAALAEQAERGFSPDQLQQVKPGKAGRPSLSGRAGASNRVNVRLDDGLFAAVEARAADRGVKPSEVIRDALREHLKV